MCIAWEGIGSLSACVSISRAAALIDDAIETEEFATNQQCCYEGWLAILLCLGPHDVSTALPRDRVFTATSDLCVKGRPRNVFSLTVQPAWLVRKSSYRLHIRADAHTYNLHVFLTGGASPFSAQLFSSHVTQAHRRTPILTHNPSPPPANKIWRMKTVRWSFPLWHRGSSGNIQTALPQAMKSNRSSLQSQTSVIKGCSFPVRVSTDPLIPAPRKKTHDGLKSKNIVYELIQTLFKGTLWNKSLPLYKVKWCLHFCLNINLCLILNTAVFFHVKHLCNMNVGKHEDSSVKREKCLSLVEFIILCIVHTTNEDMCGVYGD